MRLILFTVLLPFALSAADPITTAFKARYETQKLNFTESAVAMPEENMAFRLTPDQRSFADWIEHTADMNYRMCAQIVGQKMPQNDVKGAQYRGKKAVSDAINASFSYCDGVFAGLTDAKAIEKVDVMFSYIANLNAHYGNIVGYMRMKGVIPPSTVRASKAKKKG